jgi:hypothetical protein
MVARQVVAAAAQRLRQCLLPVCRRWRLQPLLLLLRPCRCLADLHFQFGQAV